MICVECAADVVDVYKEFSTGNARLTRCGSCKKAADKYVEFETMLIILDLILHKIQVYRHILFNVFPNMDEGLTRIVLKMIPGIIFFDTYLRWHRIHSLSILKYSLILPYNAYISLFWASTFELIAFVGGVIIAARILTTGSLNYLHLIVSVIISSFGKLFIVLMMIWDCNAHYGPIINIFVLSSNITALRVSLGTTSIKATAIVASAFIIRLLVQLALRAYDPFIVFSIL
uniref:Protein ARV n=1 Tax=Spongospora subterranea TaxID=70186 RepID=A0A0H5QZ26_9EUKA|eukprot:CRZ06967.1 hypothetical protein [Spongospora subterranea]